MISKIADVERLKSLTIRLKENNFKPGFDNMTADAARLWVEINGERLCRELKTGKWSPMPAIGFTSAKQNGKFRLLTKLTAIDTIIQYALLDDLSELYEPSFSDSSFAYRPGKGLSSAVNMYIAMASRYSFALKYDPKSCFDNIDWIVLSEILQIKIKDSKVLSLIMSFVQMPIYTEDRISPRYRGILQGSPLSPLLCNIYLNELDEILEAESIPFIRYADDIVAFANSYPDIQRYDTIIDSFLKEKLKLERNVSKCKIDTPSNIKYLGYEFKVDKKGIIALETNSNVKDAYHTWHETSFKNNKRRTDIISDGILRQKDYSIQFDGDSEKSDIPCETTGVINIYSSVIFDTGFLNKAFEHGIIINVFDKSHRLIGEFIPFTELKEPKLTFDQLEAYYDEDKRMVFARNFVLSSVHNIRLNIRYYNKRDNLPLYTNALDKLDSLYTKIKSCKKYEKILLYEAQTKEIYYSCFDSFIASEEIQFVNRSRRPPKNEINAMISFGNTILYNLIQTEICKTSLDVRIGYLHATNKRKASLNLDIADVFKPLVVDRTIFTLMNKKMINQNHFTTNENGSVYMNDEGMHVFLREFYDKLDSTITVKNRKTNYYEIIKNDIYSIIRHFHSGEKYIPYRQVR